MRRVKFGDVFEIPTSRGLAYAQYTHKNKLMGSLIRVISGFHSTRPENVEKLASESTNFKIFFPVSAAINKGIFELIGNASIPLEDREFPIFRAGNYSPETKSVAEWWLWDGENDLYLGSELTSEQWKYPLQRICNDTYLISLLESEKNQEEALF